MSSFYVELPCNILEDNDGIFSEKQVRDIVERHAASGSYSMLRYHGRDPYFLAVEPIVSGVTMEWTQHESDTHYDVYYSNSPSPPWVLANSSSLENDSVGNYLTVSGLNSYQNYYFKIESVTSAGTLLGESNMIKVKPLSTV